MSGLSWCTFKPHKMAKKYNKTFVSSVRTVRNNDLLILFFFLSSRLNLKTKVENAQNLTYRPPIDLEVYRGISK